MMNKLRATFLLSLTLLAFTLAAQAQDVTITVATDQPGWTISKYLTGMHTVYGNEPDAFWENPMVADWMKSADVGIIRYPGGTAVQHWHWDDPSGISFRSDSWDPKYDEEPRDPKQWMNLKEYISFCRKIGAEPMVGINIGSGKEYDRRDDSLESARRLIQHCKKSDYRVKHWYIGNECFIGWNAKTYAKEIDEYARVLRQVDPDITIIGDWKFGPESKKRFAQTIWTERP